MHTFAHLIETKYHGPTNARGARVKVSGLGQARTYSLDYTTSDVHTWAFERFVSDLGVKVTQCLHSETKRGNVFLITKA